MRRWRWLGAILAVLVALAVTAVALPSLVRHVAIVRIHALTRRPVTIDRVELALLSGRATIRGFRVTERDGRTPFADFERLDLRAHLPSLLVGHVWLRELILTRSTVRVVRLPTGDFNFSDLIRRSGSGGGPLDVTVDYFAVREGTVTLDDRALPEPRTWASEKIEIEAHGLSTRRDDGHAVGRSLTAGAPVSVEVRNLRLYPIRLRATIAVQNLDVTPAQVYLPPDSPVVMSRGRVDGSMTLALDAREGLSVDSIGRLQDVAFLSRDGASPLALVPKLSVRVAGLRLRSGDELRLAALALDGTVSVRDPRPKAAGPLRTSTVRVSLADLTWPATTPGRVDAAITIPDGGSLTLTGAIQPPPAPSQLRMRVTDLVLAPWTQFLPVAARVSGVAQADLRMNEPLAAGVPARLQGSIAVNRVAAGDGRHDVIAARRVEASGLLVHWPTRVVVERLRLTGLRGSLERDRTGAFPVQRLFARPPSSSRTPPRMMDTPPALEATPPVAIEVHHIAVRDGAMTWRDETTSPATRLDVSDLTAGVTGVSWPLRGPADVHVTLRPPGGGQVHVRGRVGLAPVSADVHLTARSAELAPYQPYLPTTARLTGAVDVDVAVAVPSLAERRATARGRAGLSNVEVRDGQRTVMRVDRASATGLDVQWPERIAVGRLALDRPWVVLERDAQGGLPLRKLVKPPPASAARPGAPDEAASGSDGPSAVPSITVGELRANDGGMRVVDQAVSPAFAVDVQPIALRAQDIATASDRPARVELHGGLGPGAEIAVRGTVGALGGPLRLALDAHVREFAVPRANPYVLQQAGWKTTEGRLTSTLHARVDGDALAARTEIRVSRLQLVRAAADDGAQARIGLPLDMLTALMKDHHGDITVAFPIGGRLGDPRFDFSEAVWNAVRSVAVRAITLPVSWIGRVRFTPDSRIERIEIDPVAFSPGTPAPSDAGQMQAARLAAFLDELQEVRMAVTPVVSPRDIDAMKRRAVEAAIERVERHAHMPRDAAAARVFEETFPGRQAPESLQATVDALVEHRPVAASAIDELATRRMDALRGMVKHAGVDPDRLLARERVERDDGEPAIEVEVVAPEAEQPSKLREALRRLGVPVGKDR